MTKFIKANQKTMLVTLVVVLVASFLYDMFTDVSVDAETGKKKFSLTI